MDKISLLGIGIDGFFFRGGGLKKKAGNSKGGRGGNHLLAISSRLQPDFFQKYTPSLHKSSQRRGLKEGWITD